MAIEPRPSEIGQRGTMPRVRRGAGLASALLALLVAMVPGASHGDGDQASRLTPTRDASGEGFVFKELGLWFAGDATLVGNFPEGRTGSLDLEDLDLLMRYEPTPRLSFFSELRLEQSFRLDDSSIQPRSGEFSIERLYADFALTPRVTLRVGKFLTPFGLWNVISRAPLTWTVERPVITETGFPDHATGLGVIYQTTEHGWTLDATAYGPAQDEIQIGASDDESGILVGGRVAAGHQLGPAYAAVGVNAAGFEDGKDDVWADASGVDLDVSLYGHTITGELSYKHLHGGAPAREWGWYLQDVIPIRGRLYAVGRIEQFQPTSGPPVTGELIGLFWRPLPYLLVKADYQFTNRRTGENLQRGLLISIGLFF